MKNIPDEKLQNPIIQNILSTTNTFTQSPYGRNDDLINVEAVTQEGYKKFHSYVIALEETIVFSKHNRDSVLC